MPGNGQSKGCAKPMTALSILRASEIAAFSRLMRSSASCDGVTNFCGRPVDGLGFVLPNDRRDVARFAGAVRIACHDMRGRCAIIREAEDEQPLGETCRAAVIDDDLRARAAPCRSPGRPAPSNRRKTTGIAIGARQTRRQREGRPRREKRAARIMASCRFPESAAARWWRA